MIRLPCDEQIADDIDSPAIRSYLHRASSLTLASRPYQAASFNPEGMFTSRQGTSFSSLVSMSNDFYCDEVLSGHTPVEKVLETDDVLAFHHTRPFYPVHVVVIPKRHVGSLLTLGEADDDLLLELIKIIRQVAARIVEEHGACRVLTNLGEYQESKHLHWHVASGRPLR